jgi:uncharacterized protein (TIGR02145 family)
MKYNKITSVFVVLFLLGCKDSVSPDEIVCIDIDGNVYETVQIGDQIWTTTNLKTTHYRNGDPIPTGYSNSEWSNLDDTDTGAYAEYPEDEDSQSEATCGGNCSEVYGYLYNWYAVDDARGLAPEGWHIPTDEEWQELVNFYGGSSIAGAFLKESGYNHWEFPNDGANNESGFTALPAGYRDYSYGEYHFMGDLGYFWSSSEFGAIHAWRRLFDNNDSKVDRSSYNKNYGFVVRLVRD